MPMLLYAAVIDAKGTTVVVDPWTNAAPPGDPPAAVTSTVSVRVPGFALAGGVTRNLSVTLLPAAIVTGPGLLAVQPAGTLSVNWARLSVKSPSLTSVALTVAVL